MNKAQAQILALSEIKRNHPALFEAAVRATKKQRSKGDMLKGLGETETKSLWDRLSENIVKLGGAYLTIKNQKDMVDLNIERARQGLPPLDIGSTAPVVRTQVDLPPGMVNQLTSEAGMGLNKILLFGGAAILAVMLIKKFK